MGPGAWPVRAEHVAAEPPGRITCAICGPAPATELNDADDEEAAAMANVGGYLRGRAERGG
jgi:hypothetical protein